MLSIYIFFLFSFQITGETVGEVRAVSGMHQRKAEMARQADAFIALPGIIFIKYHKPDIPISFLLPSTYSDISPYIKKVFTYKRERERQRETERDI